MNLASLASSTKLAVDDGYQKEKELLDAIEALDEHAVKRLVANGTDVNARHLHIWKGRSPLSTAIERSKYLGNPSGESESDDGQYGDGIATFLINSGARNAGSYSSLEELTLDVLGMKSQPQAALSLLKLTIKDIDKAKALIAATRSGQVEAMQILLDSGARVNGRPTDWDLPILIATTKGHNEALQLLLNSGADVNARNLVQRSPMLAAAEEGNIEIMKLLLKSGADVNTIGRTPIVAAAERGDVETIQILLDSGANVNAQDEDMRTPVIAAAENGHAEVMKILINSGANVNPQNLVRRTPIQEAAKKGHIEALEVLLDSGANIESHGFVATLAILLAAKTGHIKVIRALIESGVNVKAPDSHGTTPIHMAVKNGHAQAAQVLLDSRADINAQDLDGMTPILMATNSSFHEVAKVLLDLYPDLHLVDRNGRTALGVAVDRDDELMAHMLLKHLSLRNDSQDAEALSLDRAIGGRDYQTALSLLENDVRVARREMKALQLKSNGERHPIVGPNEFYLKKLCSIARELQINIQGASRLNDTTNSDQSFLYASEWLLDCLTRHTVCINAESVLPYLPSRIIDIEPPGEQRGLIMLRPGRGLQGRYIALSHRWGASVTLRTTKQNLEAHLKGISFCSLTKVMQDAVTVARKLGIRYLWIDALCIIQDSHSDWSVEACDMANIYRNSFLTIAAAASTTHSESFFTKRSRPSTSLKSTDDILDSRGWILQEQLLSPRILKYSNGHISWECISLSTSDCHQAGTLELATPSEIIRFKRALSGFRSTSMALQKQAHASWQHIVQSYSHRVLTNEADKLMAIMGIERFTSEITGDCFLAGLWRSQLWRGLLWKSDVSLSGGTLPPRIRGIKLPSWSWASAGAPVEYTWPHGSSPGYLTNELELLSDNVSSEISNGDVQGCLVVKTRLRKVFMRFENEYDSYRLFHSRGLMAQIKRRGLAKEGKEAEPGTNMWKQITSSIKEHYVRHQSSSSTQPRQKEPQKEQKRPLRERPMKHSSSEDDSYERIQYEAREYHDRVHEGDLKADRSDLYETFWPDAGDELFTKAWLLPIASEYYWIHCLVVVKVGKGKEFRRVGLSYVDRRKSPGFFISEPKVTITLI